MITIEQLYAAFQRLAAKMEGDVAKIKGVLTQIIEHRNADVGEFNRLRADVDALKKVALQQSDLDLSAWAALRPPTDRRPPPGPRASAPRPSAPRVVNPATPPSEVTVNAKTGLPEPGLPPEFFDGGEEADA